MRFGLGRGMMDSLSQEADCCFGAGICIAPDGR